MVNKPGSLYTQKPNPSDGYNHNHDQRIQVIGTGLIGGKAQGLVFLQDLLSSSKLLSTYPQIKINVPDFTVIGTDVFDIFLKQKDLYPYLDSDHTDAQISLAFQKSDLHFFLS